MSLRHLLGIESLSTDDMETILDTAAEMKRILSRPIPKVAALRGRRVCTLFYEASTRTRTSFETAAKTLGADTCSVAASSSSVSKGESLKDTVQTLRSLGVDLIVLRHPSSGAPHVAARHFEGAIVNAGDGTHEHPSQALLDCFTIREHFGKIAGLKIAIVGDILHSRVARSCCLAFSKLGASVTLCGPSTLLPPTFSTYGVEVTHSLEEALRGTQVIYMLRIQLERQQAGLFPSFREYSRLFALTAERLALADEEAVVMHPGPINRGIELTAEVADDRRSLILSQVTNGVAVRMALLYLLLGGAPASLTASERSSS